MIPVLDLTVTVLLHKDKDDTDMSNFAFKNFENLVFFLSAHLFKGHLSYCHHLASVQVLPVQKLVITVLLLEIEMQKHINELQ